MGDNLVPATYVGGVKPDAEILKKIARAEIVSKEAQVKRLEADKEEIIQGQVLRIEAKIMMLKKEVVHINNNLTNMEPIDV
jgi:hypothetical protein